MTPSSLPSDPESVKIAADFLALALADVLFILGGSAMSENAGAMSFGVKRLQNPSRLTASEVKSLRTSLGVKA